MEQNNKLAQQRMIEQIIQVLRQKESEGFKYPKCYYVCFKKYDRESGISIFKRDNFYIKSCLRENKDIKLLKNRKILSYVPNPRLLIAVMRYKSKDDLYFYPYSVIKDVQKYGITVSEEDKTKLYEYDAETFVKLHNMCDLYDDISIGEAYNIYDLEEISKMYRSTRK